MNAQAETAIRDFLANALDQEVACLKALIQTPSDNPPGDCALHGERTAALLEAMGFTVERHPVPEELCQAHGMRSATNLIVRHRFADGPIIALNAHGDVVGPGEGWSKDPYGAVIEDGWIYGRGAAVSKSDIASYAYALKALIAAAEAGATFKGGVELHITYDEETGGEIGPKLLLEQGLSKPDYAIGAGFSYAVVTAHNGCLHLKIEVKGKSAHAALPATGIDALEAAVPLMSALYAYRDDLSQRESAIAGIGSPQLTVGLIEGGINTNVVPDKVTMRLDRRMIPEEDADEVEAELRQLIARVAAERPAARVEVERILLARPLTPIRGSDLLARTLEKHASAIMGEEVRAKGVPLYTDARHYAEAGVPVVLYGAGPHTIEEANAHRADERLPLDDLKKATLVVALSLADLLQSKTPA